MGFVFFSDKIHNFITRMNLNATRLSKNGKSGLKYFILIILLLDYLD